MDIPKNQDDADTRRGVVIELAQAMADTIPDDADADVIACAAATILNRAYLPYGWAVQITLIPIISGRFEE